MSFEKRLEELDIVLPESPTLLGAYIPCVQSGGLLFISGMLPLKDGKLLYTGKVNSEVSLEEAQISSRQAVLNALTVIRSCSGSLDNVIRCVKLNGFVASSDSFYDHPKVINAASDLLFELFGENGRHARAAVGVYNLPLNAPVEIDFVFEVKTI